MVSTLSLKNLEKTEKFYFQRFITFFCYFKVPSKSFFKILPMTKFGFIWSYEGFASLSKRMAKK